MTDTATPDIDLEKTSTGYIIFVTGEICQELADAVTQKLIEIDMINKSKGKLEPITLIINSPGGDLLAAWQICDIMDYVDSPVYTTGLGQIASAALIIFMNGQPGHRTLTDRTSILSHRYSWGINGSHTDLIAVQPELYNIHEKIVSHYIECTGLSRKVIEDSLLNGHDVWLTAAQARKYRIADNVATSKKTKTLRKIRKNADGKK